MAQRLGVAQGGARWLPPCRGIPCRSDGFWKDMGRGLCLGCLTGVMGIGWCVAPVSASLTDALTSDHAIVFDAAKIVPSSKREETDNALLRFEQETGWRIRLLSTYQGESSVTDDDIREVWRPDDKTVIMAFDPSSPNVVAFRFIGDDIQAKLKRPFWVELQTRFGNIFFIRKEGEAAAVEGILDVVQTCLQRPEGCVVVPGLSADHFYATLVLSIAGGVVLGFSSKIEQEGSMYQRLGWLLVFSPLWLILFVNLGLGPVVSRTEDRWPVFANSTAFLVTASIFQFIEFPPKWMKADISLTNDDDAQDDETYY